MEDLFGPLNSDDEKEENTDPTGFKEQFEIEDVDILDVKIKIRVFNFHILNANFVWPGNHPFSEYLIKNWNLLDGKRIIELGAGTGVLSIFLKKKGIKEIVTSDYDDPQIGDNIEYNWKLNGYDGKEASLHIPHTWGAPLPSELPNFDVILCNDCILYVSQYPNLIKTIQHLLKKSSGNICIFSCGRRIKKEYENLFFQMAKEAGMEYELLGRRIYKIYQPSAS